MQNLKLFAFAVLGAGALAFGSLTSTGCEASAEATGGAAGDSGSAGTGNTAGTTAAGGAGAGGAAAGAGGAAAGSGGSTGNDSAALLSEALKGDMACATCLAGLKGMTKDGANADVNCDGIVGKCNGDQECQNFIASAKTAGADGMDTDANCWVEAGAIAVNGGNAVTQEMIACSVALCGTQCGGLTFTQPSGCD